MSILSRLFGKKTATGAPKSENVVTYEDFRITPTPIKESGGYRISARIEKDIDGETKVHNLIRADVVAGEEEAIKAIIRKCQQAIDQMGERIF